MNNVIGIYWIRNRLNGKIYIGSSINIKKRLKEHYNKLTKNRHNNKILQNCVNKYGIDSFDFELIHELSSHMMDVEIRVVENIYMELLSTKDRTYGFNINDALHTCARIKPSEETRRKMREAGKKKTFSEETRRKISEACKGRKLCEETRQKISRANKGRPSPLRGIKLSEEIRRKISEGNKGQEAWNKGKKHSEESREKMSESHKGQEAWNKGKKHSEEIRRKISEGLKSKTVNRIPQWCITQWYKHPNTFSRIEPYIAGF